MTFETPADLLRRLKLGREETFQRLLTSLILRGPYPPWNQRSTPSPQGIAFLRSLFELTIGGDWPGDDLIFVDELELPARHDAEKGGAPDWAAVWDDHLWLIELKTEKGSHRAGQVPSYFELGHHHFPSRPVDLTYLTGPMTFAFEPTVDGDRYAHVTWADVAPLVRATWGEPTEQGEADVVDGVLHGIDHLHLRPAEWRALVLGEELPIAPPSATTPLVPEPELAVSAASDLLDAALALAAETAADRKQRALDHRASGLDELLELRLACRDAIAGSDDEALRHVVPWLWRIESTGTALTSAGAEAGREIRFSRYTSAQYD